MADPYDYKDNERYSLRRRAPDGSMYEVGSQGYRSINALADLDRTGPLRSSEPFNRPIPESALRPSRVQPFNQPLPDDMLGPSRVQPFNRPVSEDALRQKSRDFGTLIGTPGAQLARNNGAAASGGYSDRSGSTERERQGLQKRIDDQIASLGPLNMRSKRELVGQLLGLKRNVTADRMGQLGDADKLVTSAEANNADLRERASARRNQIAMFNTGEENALNIEGLRRQGNPMDAEEQRARINVLNANAAMAGELHDPKLQAEKDAEFNSRVEARVKTDGIPRDQAIRIEREVEVNAGNAPSDSTLGGASETETLRRSRDRLNAPGFVSGVRSWLSGDYTGNNAAIDPTDEGARNANNYVDEPVDTGLGGLYNAVVPFAPTLNRRTYTGGVPKPGMDQPSYNYYGDDPGNGELTRQELEARKLNRKARDAAAR